MKLAYFDCFSGASGDMLLGSLLDAGLALADLESDLSKLKLSGYRLAAERVTRRGLTGTHLCVLTETDDRPARHLSTINEILVGSELSEWTKTKSLAVFRRIAQVEAQIHGTDLEQVHFHEIGALDSLVDVVGFVCGLERMGTEAVYSSPLPLGSGTILTEHGRLPVPAPATLALLAQAGVPTVPGPAQTELVTPTGAALLTEFATFVRPPMAVKAVGYGFGTKEFDWPNALRVWLGESMFRSEDVESDQAIKLDCNLDDATGEVLGYVMERVLAAGALDVWFTPIQMKKNRPATQVSVLVRPENADDLAALLLQETPTLGVRRQSFSRTKSRREMGEVSTPWGPIRVKLKLLQGQIVSASPEYDDCARLALQAGTPLQEVMAAALQAARQLISEKPAPTSS